MTVTDPLFDAAVVEDPHPYFTQLREHDPVHFVEGANTYLVSRMSLIQQVVADTTTYSNHSVEFLSDDDEDRPGLRSQLDHELGDDVPGRVPTADAPDRTRQRWVRGRVLSAGSIARRAR